MTKAFEQALASGVALAACLAPALGDPASGVRSGQFAGQAIARLVRPQPDPSPDVAPFTRMKIPASTMARRPWTRFIRALREKVKFVFVIFNENQSFDGEFADIPGRQRPFFRRRKAPFGGGDPRLHPELYR